MEWGTLRIFLSHITRAQEKTRIHGSHQRIKPNTVNGKNRTIVFSPISNDNGQKRDKKMIDS